jgi:hypothetical protein
MSVDGSFLDKHDLVLLKMLVGWYGIAGSHLSRRENEMPRAVGFGSDLEDESPMSPSPGSGRQRRASPSFFSSSSGVAPDCAGALGFCCADTVTNGRSSNAERTALSRAAHRLERAPTELSLGLHAL